MGDSASLRDKRKMNKSKLKIASFFAGNGGFDYAAQKAGDFETVYANEISRRAYETFEMNFPLEVDKRSIWDIKPEELPDFDVLCGGFPCQSFSSAGRQAGRQAGRMLAVACFTLCCQ